MPIIDFLGFLKREVRWPMLDFLRQRTRSWVIKFLLGIIVFVFVLWGVGSYMREPGVEAVAHINGEEVSQSQFEAQYQKIIDVYRELFKGSLTPEMIKSLNLRSTVLGELIQRKLLLQEARRLGLEVSDNDLMDAISQVPDFQVNGRFAKERYLQALRSKRLTPGQFELEQKELLTIQKLYDMIQVPVYITEAEVRDRYRLEQENVNFYFLRLSASDFLTQVKIKEEEIKNAYERNREAYREPAKVQVEYVSYPFEYFGSKLGMTEKEIEEYYQSRVKSRFHEPKSVRIRHILLRAAAGGDPKEREKIRVQAEKILQQARAGKDFSELVREFSEDPQGVDAQWMTQGQMPPPLEKAAFGLKKGEVSNVVETPLGYFILKAEDIKEEKTKALKEVREEIVRSLKTERGRSEAAKAIDADREKAFSGVDFSLLAKERGIPFKVTPWFSRAEPLSEVDSAEEFNKAAYSLAQKEISPAVEGPKAYYLMRLKQRRESFVPSFESVRGAIESRLKEAKAFELANQKGTSLLGELRKEGDIRKLAAQHNVPLMETGWFTRSAPEIPKVGALQEVKPGGLPLSSLQPAADRIYTQKGTVYIFAFKESKGADMERFEKEKQQLMEKTLAEKRQKALERYLELLKAKARIQVQPAVLEQS
ncbi:MAG: SurA N-terminal domain-containing protein [Deltaproteobacteria bacterium]|nr:SurA N-terminal domain-containing protein [Deltaproteobacteria bacterium]